jgi:hypothetical protein
MIIVGDNGGEHALPFEIAFAHISECCVAMLIDETL